MWGVGSPTTPWMWWETCRLWGRGRRKKGKIRMRVVAHTPWWVFWAVSMPVLVVSVPNVAWVGFNSMLTEFWLISQKLISTMKTKTTVIVQAIMIMIMMVVMRWFIQQQQQQQMHSQEPQIHQACDSFMNEAMAAVNNGYEPCGNYLSREKSNPLAFRRPEYGEPFPCDLDSVKVLTLSWVIFWLSSAKAVGWFNVDV